MTRMKKSLLVVTVLAILGIVGSAMQKAQPAASTPTTFGIPVTVASPLPMPVSGTVSAQQSGTWNVGINGTPSVNIANSPTVNLASSATTPLFFRNVDDPGRIPYQSTVTTSSCITYLCTWNFPAVPANHRLVVQHLSGYLVFKAATEPFVAGIQSSSGNNTIGFLVPATWANATTSGFDQPILDYFDGGSSFQAFVQGLSNIGNPFATASITVTGYLLDCSAAPCAAIAQ